MTIIISATIKKRVINKNCAAKFHFLPPLWTDLDLKYNDNEPYIYIITGHSAAIL